MRIVESIFVILLNFKIDHGIYYEIITRNQNPISILLEINLFYSYLRFVLWLIKSGMQL